MFGNVLYKRITLNSLIYINPILIACIRLPRQPLHLEAKSSVKNILQPKIFEIKPKNEVKLTPTYKKTKDFRYDLYKKLSQMLF